MSLNLKIFFNRIKEIMTQLNVVFEDNFFLFYIIIFYHDSYFICLNKLLFYLNK